MRSYVSDKFYGSSSETKPTSILDGATFYEYDTLKSYLLVNGAWQLLIGGSGGAGSGITGDLYWNRLGTTVFPRNLNDNISGKFLISGGFNSRNLVEINANIINVKDYGAKGDASVDDTIAIRRAISGMNSDYRSVLYFPAGYYTVSGGISMPVTNFSGWIIRGDSIRNTIIHHIGPGNCFIISGNTSTTPSSYGIIENIRFDSSNNATSNDGLVIKNLYRLKIRDVESNSFGNCGLYLDGTTASDEIGIVDIDNCHLEGNGTGIRIGGVSNNIHDIRVHNSAIESNSKWGVWMRSNSAGFSVINNVIEANGSGNIYIDNIGGLSILNNYIESNPTGIYIDNSAGSLTLGGILVAGNTLQSTSANGTVGIRIGSSSANNSGINIQNNWLNGWHTGIHIFNSLKTSVIGPNLFDATTITPIAALPASTDAIIIHDGKVGIAGKLPGTPLDVKGSITFGINGNGLIYDNSTQVIHQVFGNDISFFDNSANLTRFIIKNDGKLGFGTNAPSTFVDITGQVRIGDSLGINTSNPKEKIHVSGGNIELSRNQTVGIRNDIQVGVNTGYLDFGIKKSAGEDRFCGIKIIETSGTTSNVSGSILFFTDIEGTAFSTEQMRLDGFGDLKLNGNFFCSKTITGKLIDFNTSINNPPYQKGRVFYESGTNTLSFNNNTGLFPIRLGDKNNQFELKEDFIGVSGNNFGWSAFNSGAGTSIIGDNSNVNFDHMGIMRLSAGTAITGFATICLSGGFLISGIKSSLEFLVKSDTASTSTDRYLYRIGWGDNIRGDFLNGMHFQYSDNLSTGWWWVKTSNAGIKSSGFASVSGISNNWNLFRIDCDTSGAYFYINGTGVANISTNLPTGTNTFVMPICQVQKLAGSNNRFLDVDTFNLTYTYNNLQRF